MIRSVVLVALVAAPCVTPCLHAQRTRFGIAFGTSWVGGGDSRVLVPVLLESPFNVTGADQSGYHFRIFAETPLGSPSFSFRTELFYNKLHSRPNSYAIVGNGIGTAALTDRTFGLMGTFVATFSPRARVSPYFLLGAGFFGSQLGTNPDPSSSQVAITLGGMGLGLQTGIGLRFRVATKTELMLEWRLAQAFNNTRGATFMPFTFGIKF